MNLEKATLTKLKRQTDPTAPDETEGDAVPVQFNPSSLRLSLTNQVEGGETRGRQDRQFAGNSSTDLSFDLHFDTADEGSTDAPVSVRTRTALVEQFVVPGQPNSSERVAPPRVQFSWGGPQGLKISGIITSLSLDFDLFAPNGVPLRAKVGISMREQNARYELAVRQQAQAGASAPPPGGLGAGPGSQGGGPTNRTGQALGGESLADFAGRMGLDPSAWRGLSAGLSGSLSLEAGAAIDFSAGLSAGVGLGATAGLEVGVGASLEASFGLDVSASASATASVSIGGTISASAEANAGFALAAAGGVSAAVETVAMVKAEAAQQQALASFGAPLPSPSGSSGGGAPSPASAASAGPAALPPAAPAAKPAMPDQPRPPLQRTGLPSFAQQAAAAPAPPPPRVDPRAVSFGRGVPLRPRIALPDGAASGGAPPSNPDPGAPPWISLPARDVPREAADRAQAQRRPSNLCGCVGVCTHRRGRRWL